MYFLIVCLVFIFNYKSSSLFYFLRDLHKKNMMVFLNKKYFFYKLLKNENKNILIASVMYIVSLS